MLRFAVCCGMRAAWQGGAGLDISTPRSSSSDSRRWGSATQCLFHPPSLPGHLGLPCGLTAFSKGVRQTGSQSQSSSVLNPKAEVVVAPCCSMLLHGILIGNTNWAGPSFPSISSWDMLQTSTRAGREQSLQEVTVTLCNLWG